MAGALILVIDLGKAWYKLVIIIIINNIIIMPNCALDAMGF